MYVQDLIEVLCAAHLTYLLHTPFPERSGIILVGAPGVLKSTFLEELDKQYPNVITMSDLNVKTLITFRDQIAAGTIQTLVFPELQKLYERKDETAANLEGTLRALVAEGFQAASFEDQRVNRVRARCLVIGAMTPATQARRFQAWDDSGFNRRFLWSLIRLSDPQALDEAVLEWKRLDFRIHHVPQIPPFGDQIPNLTTRAERQQCRMLVKYQPGGSGTQQAQFLIKVAAVLKWWYTETHQDRDAMQVISSFGESLGREGAKLKLRPLARSTVARAHRKEQEIQQRQAAKLLANKRWHPGGVKKKGR
jgi:hypothetical protein